MKREERWARVRGLDGTGNETCNRCGQAVLYFKADFDCTGTLMPAQGTARTADVQPTEVTQTVKTDIYSCLEHAGEFAFAAAYTVVAGPTGAV